MDYQNIVSERIGAVARIRLNRPAVRNAQDRSLLRELDHALRAAETSSGLSVLVLQQLWSSSMEKSKTSGGSWAQSL